jgi:hypothetical protein
MEEIECIVFVFFVVVVVIVLVVLAKEIIKQCFD